MTQPEAFEVKGQERKVCRLNHSIYGLKQSLSQWNSGFHEFITSIGFDIIKEDHCVYLAKDVVNEDQSCYIKKLNVKVLILAFRYHSNPGETHWKDVKRIFRYLHGTTDLVLCYYADDLILRGYSDGDWASDRDERKSTSGNMFIIDDGYISWRNKKKTCVALSTMEVEYIICSEVVQEAVSLKRFLERFAIKAYKEEVALMYYDSMAALGYVKDPNYHKKTKHIDARYYFFRDMVAKEMVLRHISTSMMVVDLLTKPIARDVFLLILGAWIYVVLFPEV
ncbi:Retrovirus-related Pol polyprotein from transposon TNT 1-94-like protein [Drosera capensis]